MAPNTFATVATSLGNEMMVLASLHGQEALGRLFHYELDLFSLDPDIEFESVIGQPVTVQLELTEDNYRFINGIVTRFERVGESGRFSVYRAVMRPWLWLLTRTQDSRIFHNKTIPELAKELLRSHGLIEEHYSRSYRRWDYLVQYRESTFNFVSRLLEQEGIYYYWKHENGKHTLCLCDSPAAHEPADGYADIPYFPPYPAEQRERDHIDGWRVSQELQAGAFVMRDYDFKVPKASLEAHLTAPANGTQLEVFDYPGEYEKSGDGERYTRLWMERVSSQYAGVEGHGNARGLLVGNRFKLTDYPRSDQNQEYLVTAASISLDVGGHESGQRTEQGPTYRCAFRALRYSQQFRPARETHRPEIAGPQTAIVVGASPEDEIHTDEYGRVKVRFYWQRPHEDSNAQPDDPVSCWVRVAQVWAGARWGAMHVPRVGQEVIVEFLEGDPSRPIINGRVYNADNMPPYDLPKNKTQSGIKSRSSKDGSPENFNELRFEDLKGEEQVFLQAEKDLSEKVKHDHHTHVGANQSNDVVKDHAESVGGEQSLRVTGNRTVHIDGSQSVTISGSKAADGVSGSKVNVTGDHQFDASKTIKIQAPVSITLECGGSSILIEPSKISIIAGGQAVMVLDTAALVQAAAGAKLQLDTSVVAQAALGAQITLDANALVEGIQSTVSGRLLAQTVAGASSVTAGPAGVAVTGVPMVKIN